MARKTSRIKIHRLRIEVMMRVMASQAADSCVVWVETFATRQPVGLKANIGDARVVLKGNFCPGSMTLAAKVGRLFRGEPDQFL